MGIVTKTGDKGRTSLLWGGRVAKDDLMVEAYGTVDELCSFLGLAKSLAPEKRVKGIIEDIQKDLFVIGAEAASRPRFIHKLAERIGEFHIKRLEKIINQFEAVKSFEECCFYLPGESLLSSSLDVARTVARRAERRLVALKRKKILKNDNCVIYLNRASDLLYLLARSYDETSRRAR